MTDAPARSRVSAWRYALRTTNPPDGPIDALTRWIVVSRAAVLPMTLVAGLVAGLLAARAPTVDWRWLALAVLGITLAHLANNLMNDLYDTRAGSDTASYPRALYAPHPILSGLITRRALVVSVLAINAADLAILVVLALARGWPVVAFALAG
ncbi:MAG: prenyltransferase, partial [Actinomycetota bacterium]|nr:prenyltransferase [Actinomycetota bacterium]